MASIITSRTRRVYLRPPKPPFTLNKADPAARGIVAWWPLGHAGLGRGAVDATGNGRHMTMNNTPTVSPGPGLNGTAGRGIAATYNGSNQNHEYTTAPIFTAYPFTIEGWGNSTNATAEQAVAVGTDAAGDDWITLGFAGNVAGDPVRAGRHASGGTERHAATTTGYTVGQWHHACGTFPSTTLATAYIDGGSAGTNGNTVAPTFSDFQHQIGAFKVSSTYFSPFAGRLCDVIIRNVDLTADEVRARFDPKTRWSHYWRLFRKAYSFGVTAATPGGGNRRRRMLMGAS